MFTFFLRNNTNSYGIATLQMLIFIFLKIVRIHFKIDMLSHEIGLNIFSMHVLYVLDKSLPFVVKKKKADKECNGKKKEIQI